MTRLKSLAQIPWNKAQWNSWDNLTSEERQSQEDLYEQKRDKESKYGQSIRND